MRAALDVIKLAKVGFADLVAACTYNPKYSSYDFRWVDEETVRQSLGLQVKAVKITKFVLVYCFLASLAVAALAFNYSNLVYQPKKYDLIATDFKGNSFRATPVQNGLITDEQALGIAVDWTTKLLSLRFDDYNRQAEGWKDMFLHDGYQDYLSSLVNKDTLKTVRDKKLIVRAIPAGLPYLSGTRTSFWMGTKTWYIKVPVYQSVSGATEKTAVEERMASMILQEVNRTENPQGVQIKFFKVD